MHDKDRPQHGYTGCHGYPQSSDLGSHFSVAAARRLNDTHLSPSEWEMVMQARIATLLRPYEDALKSKDTRIAQLQARLQKYEQQERQAELSAQIATFMAVGQDGPTMLVDGSGSMAHGEKNSRPLESALRAVAASSAGRTLLWGDSRPVTLDVKDEQKLSKAINGLGCGSDLYPALEMMSFVKGPQHLVIVSDGDIFDENKCQPALEKMLAGGNVKIDAIIIKSRSEQTRMEKFLSQFTGSRVTVCAADVKEIKKAIGTLTRQPAAKKAHQPKR